MKSIFFMLRQSRLMIAAAIAASVLSGVSTIALLASINRGLHHADALSSSTSVWGFVGLCAAALLTKIASDLILIRLAQRITLDLRTRLCRQLLAIPLQRLEEAGPHKVLATLTEDINVITGFIMYVPVVCISFITVIGCVVYLGTLSGPLMAGILVVMAFGIATYEIPVRAAKRYLRRSRETWDRLHKYFRALTEGFKELKLHYARRESFLSDGINRTAMSLCRENMMGYTIHSIASTWSQLLFLVVIGVMVFAIAPYFGMDQVVATGCALTVLYLRAPLDNLISLLPSLNRTTIALNKVDELGLSLTAGQADTPGQTQSLPPWKWLQLLDIMHTYRNNNGARNFRLGPINLTIRQGEIVFICGGNGSGKTTLAKILCGLYAPDDGMIRIDDEPVTEETREAYRQHFSAVFSDFYLFDSLLGIDRPDLDDKAREYLEEFQLSDHVEVKDGSLSTVQLSQGQRKRLALLTTYLEDRPIYLFDEWAADQDPFFRELFYLDLLRDLKNRGKTVIVITHDERYFNCADRLIKLDSGEVVQDADADSLLAKTASSIKSR